MKLRALSTSFYFTFFLSCTSYLHADTITTIEIDEEDEQLCFIEKTIRPDLSLKYRTDEDPSNNETYVTMELTYEGHAWLSVGLTPENSVNMIESQAIVGILTDDEDEMEYPKPKMYNMFGYTQEEVFPMFGRLQTLFDHSISTTETSTILKFSKFLEDPGHVTLSMDEPNVLIFAIGTSETEFTDHLFSGGFVLDLNQTCTIDAPIMEIADVLEHPQLNAWKVHGILAGVAWAIATPLSIMASQLRKIWTDGAHWLKLHIYFNLISAVLTIPCVVVAFLMFQQSRKTHLSKPHHVIGMIVLILTFMQLINGIFRPSAGKPDIPSTKSRLIWEKIHKSAGVLTFILSMYELFSGAKLYVTLYGGQDWTPIYGAWLGILVLFSLTAKVKLS